MPDFSYNCRSIRILEKLSFTVEHIVRAVLFCEFQCEDEHGNLLAPAKAVVVASYDEADIEGYPENILAAEAPDDEFDKLGTYCKQAPGYTFYNTEWVAEQLRTEAIEPSAPIADEKPKHQWLLVEYDCQEKTTCGTVYGPFGSDEEAVAFGRTLSDDDLQCDEYGDYCNEDGDSVFTTTTLVAPVGNG